MGSFYTRREDGGRTLFTVTPAPWPANHANLMFILGGALALFAIPLMALLIGFLLLPFVAFAVFMGLKMHKEDATERARRTVSDVVVTSDALQANERSMKRADIVEYVWHNAKRGPTIEVTEYTTSSVSAASRAAAMRKQAAQDHVQYEVAARLKSDSRPVTLVNGLTEETASALVRDLAAA